MSATAATTTEWELRMKDYVSAPFKKLVDYATGAEKKMKDVAGGMTKAAKASDSMGREFKRNYNGLESTLAKLEARQKSAFSTKHILQYQQLINRTKAEMQKLHAITSPSPQTLSAWGSLKNNISGMAAEVPGLGNGMAMLRNPLMLAGAGVFALGVGLKQSATLALDYETGMAKINATAQLGSETLGQLKGRLIEIGSASGGNFELIPAAYEKILSQTGKVNMSLDILESAVKGAKAGFTDIDTLSSAVAQSLSSIGSENANAAEVLDTFMMAKKVGAGEFKDFAQYLPSLISSGKNLAVNYKDVAGMFAYMTGKGQSAADSAMLMNNTFTALQKNEVLKGLEKKGVLLFNKNGARRNINDVFQDLSKKLDGMTDRQKSKFFIDIGLNDAQAKTAFSVMTSEAKKLDETMKDVNHSFGETDRQLAMTANRARDWGDIGDEIKGWGVAIGDFVLPAIDALVQGISGFAHDLKSLFSGEIFKDAEAYASAQSSANRNQAMLKAGELTSKKFGHSITDKNATHSAAEGKFYSDTYEKAMKELGVMGSKNNINKKESAAEKALDNVNKGLPAGGGSSSGDDSGGSKITGDGGKVRNLTMNLYITNQVKADEGANMDKVKRKLTDAIVDAARDGMATIGV